MGDLPSRRGRRAGRRPITSASSRLLASKVFTPGKKKVKGKRRPGARRAREPREGGNRGARGGEAETKGKRGERPGKPRRGGWARRTPRRGRRGRPRTLPDAPGLPGPARPREPRRFPPAPRPEERAGGGKGRRSPSRSQANTSVFVFLAAPRSGLRFTQPDGPGGTAYRAVPRGQTAGHREEEEEEGTSAGSPLLPEAPGGGRVWGVGPVPQLPATSGCHQAAPFLPGSRGGLETEAGESRTAPGPRPKLPPEGSARPRAGGSLALWRGRGSPVCT